MTHFEMVEKLREKANVSYEEAKEALEAADWDLLDAMVLLEKTGKVNAESETNYTTRQEKEKKGPEVNAKKGRTFSEAMGRFGRCLVALIKKGNENFFEVYRRGEQVFYLPVTVLVLLLFWSFWFTVPLAIVGLFFGFSYSFRGPQLGKESINKVITRASEMADEMKREAKRSHEDRGKQDEDEVEVEDDE